MGISPEGGKRVQISFVPDQDVFLSTPVVCGESAFTCIHTLITLLCVVSLHLQDDYIVTPAKVLECVEKVFIKKLSGQVNREIKKIREKR